MSFFSAKAFNQVIKSLNEKKSSKLNVPVTIPCVYAQIKSYGWSETVGKDKSRMHTVSAEICDIKSVIAAAKKSNASETDSQKHILFSESEENGTFISVPLFKTSTEKRTVNGVEETVYKPSIRLDTSKEIALYEFGIFMFTMTKDKADKPILPGSAICIRDVYSESWDGGIGLKCSSIEPISYSDEMENSFKVPDSEFESVGIVLPTGTDDICQSTKDSFKMAYHHIKQMSFHPNDIAVGESREFIIPAGNIQRTIELQSLHGYPVVEPSTVPWISGMLIAETTSQFAIKTENTTAPSDTNAPKEITNTMKGSVRYEYASETDDCEFSFTFEYAEPGEWAQGPKKNTDKPQKRGNSQFGNSHLFFCTDRHIFTGLLNANQFSFVATFTNSKDKNGRSEWVTTPAKNDVTNMPILSVSTKNALKPQFVSNFWGHLEARGLRIPNAEYKYLRQLCKDLWIMSPSNREVSLVAYRLFTYADPSRCDEPTQDWTFTINDAQKTYKGDLRQRNPLNLLQASPYKNLAETLVDPEPWIVKKSSEDEYDNEIACLYAYTGGRTNIAEIKRTGILTSNTGLTLAALEDQNANAVKNWDKMTREERNEVYFWNLWVLGRLYLGVIRKTTRYDSDKERRTKCFAGINAWLKKFAAIYYPNGQKSYEINEKDEAWSEDSNPVYHWTFEPYLFPNYRLQRKRLETSLTSKKRERPEQQETPTQLPDPHEQSGDMQNALSMAEHPKPTVEDIPKKVGKKSSKK